MPGKLITPAPTQRTNTLIITQLPAEFFHPAVLTALRDHLALFGTIFAWAPLRGLLRIILVYLSEDDAENAKHHCDGLTLDELPNRPNVTLRVFRGDPTPIDAPTSGPDGAFLCPPEPTKNFLISPPGSPPVGWEPVPEEPPNATPLADDLIAALRQLQLLDVRASRGPEVVLQSDDGVGITVYVEDCDGGKDGGRELDEDEWVYGETSAMTTAYRPPVTQRPPVAVAV